MIDRRRVLGLLVGAAAFPGAASAQLRYATNGQAVLRDKLKQDGRHALKAGQIDVSIEVKAGKVVGLSARHPNRGELKVTKVKTTERVLPVDPDAKAVPAGPYYGYWFTDGGTQFWYYWFPAEAVTDDGSFGPYPG